MNSDLQLLNGESAYPIADSHLSFYIVKPGSVSLNSVIWRKKLKKTF